MTPPHQRLEVDWFHYLFLPNNSKSYFRLIFKVLCIDLVIDQGYIDINW